MKNHLFRILAYLIVLTFLFQPIQTLANSSQVEISDNSSMAAAQTPAPGEPYGEQFEKEFEMEIEAERQRILEEHLREEGMPEELLSHEYGSHIQEKREYVPPSAEVIAKTKAQVDSFSCASVTDVPPIECEALVALYESTNGAGWANRTNWLVTTTVGNWRGVTVTGQHVTDLELAWNQLSGEIPPELGNLTNLEGLNLDWNYLSGEIPPELGNLTYLQQLNLWDNYLSEAIPPELGSLTNLQGLYLQENQLSGAIPPELGNLTNLEDLNLGGNQLSGTIPAELGSLTSLLDLRLHVNQLSGGIPPELGDLTSLEYLSFYNNQLTGSIPTWLGNLTNLEHLNLDWNQLSGEIPPELGSISSLIWLNLSHNQLSGAIPASLGNLTNLVALILTYNQLSGAIPLSFVNLTNIYYFYFDGTQLCEPTTPEFLAWKETVNNWISNGKLCEEPPQITSLEINQALGVQKNNEQNYVAGKTAVIRVLLNKALAVDSSTQRVEVTRDGSATVTLYPNKNPSKTNVLEFYCPIDSTICGNWPAGSYTINAYVGSNFMNKNATFSNTRNMKILVRPVKVIDGFKTIRLSDDDWKASYSFLKNTYPIAADGIDWVIGSEITMVGTDVSLFTSFLSFYSSFKHNYDKILAIIPPIADCNADGCYLGGSGSTNKAAACIANGSFYNPENDTWWEVESLQSCIAHELGHSYGLGDEYDADSAHYECGVNPPPENYYDCGTINQPSPWPGTGTGSLIPASDHPYEINGRGLLTDKLSFMGSSHSQEVFWISKDAYSQLFSRLKDNSVSNLEQVEESGRVILASGWIGQDDSLRLEPWYHNSRLLPETGAGEYSIEAQDSVGTVLSSQFFDIFFTDLSNPPKVLDEAFFSISMTYPIGTVRFVIKHGSSIIGIREVSPSLPSVSITSPNGGEIWDSESNQIVTWAGITDGSVFYTLLYSPDGITYDVVAVNLTTNSYEIDPAYLIGGENASFKILATNGVNTVEDTSDAPFTVLPKLPNAYIHYPQDGAIFPLGLSIILDGSGYDIEEGIIEEENISWTSDIDGFLGNGTNPIVDLSYGSHTITIEVVDSDGNTSQSNITVFIGSKIYLPTVIR